MLTAVVDILRADGIAPPDPARKSVLGKRTHDVVKEDNVDGLGDEQEIDIEKRLKALRVCSFVSISCGCMIQHSFQAQMNLLEQQLAKKGSSSKSIPNKRIKKEPAPVASGEVIDLT